MNHGVNVTPDEWGQWADYYGKLFPGATKEFIEGMTTRMIRTLSYCGMPVRMQRADYLHRLKILGETLLFLPDDSIKGGGDG